MSKFEDLSRKIDQEDIDFNIEMSRREALFDRLHSEQSPITAAVDATMVDYYRTIISPRLPATLYKKSTRQIESPTSKGQPATYGHYWKIRKEESRGVVETPLKVWEAGEFPYDTEGYYLHDVLEVSLNYKAPFESGKFEDSLVSHLSFHFWSLYSTSFELNLKKTEAIINSGIQGIQLMDGNSHYSMNHTAVVPIVDDDANQVEEKVTTLLNLITPFILDRNPK